LSSTLAVTRRWNSSGLLVSGWVVGFSGWLQAGSAKSSPFLSTAQAMRAFLAAMATTAFQ
jgi:hypothetical protein